MYKSVRNAIQEKANSEKAVFLQRFFKTGRGQYAEGDAFLGLTVPESRKIAIEFENLPFEDIKKLLISKFHEERLIALLILVHNFQKGKEVDREKIYKYYLENTKCINNWDLVDLSADKIVGEYLLNKDRSILIKLAQSKNLWERRIAMIATYAFIKSGEYADTFKIAELLLDDKHDLIHKALGWMLREVGKRVSQEIEEEFLKKHYKIMPRTALRYAIEHFPRDKKNAYMKGSVLSL